MSGFVLAIVFISTFMHAGWNLLARGQRPSIHSFFRRKLVVTVLAGLPAAALADWFLGFLPAKALLCAAGSGVFCGVYFFALGEGYAAADFTVVYPVTRGLPLLALGLGDALRGRLPTAFGWLGLVMVAAGCFAAPLPSLRGFDLRAYAHKSVIWMLLAAAGTVGYTMLDKTAAETVRSGPDSAARYLFYFYVFSLICYGALVSVFRRGRVGSCRGGWGLAGLAGLLDAGAYWLVLWAYQLTARTSYVAAFRQIGILIGMAAAFRIYREKGVAARLTAALLITAGLVTIALWGR